MPGRMEFELNFGQPGAPRSPKRGSDGPMRILVLGDFSGRSNRGPAEPVAGLSDRPILGVDVDNFERLVARLSPRLELDLAQGEKQPTAIEFRRMDDFHPDALYGRLEVFKPLREIRRQVQEPEAPVRSSGPGRKAPDASRTGTGREDDRATLDRLLGKAPGLATGRQVDIARFLERIVEPYVLPKVDPRLPELLAAVDEATTQKMRAVLHDPAFQALESAWRALRWLVTSLETGEELKIYLLDAAREEIEADLREAGERLEGSDLCRLLTDRAAEGGEGSWSLLVGNYTFGPDPRDVELLGALGAIVARTGGSFLAAADPRIFGCRSLSDTPDPGGWALDDAQAAGPWQALRRSPEARRLGLLVPRVLLRLPYGRRSDEVEQFAFEEIASPDEHEAFLWGNPAFACAFLIGKAFSERGWSMEPGDNLDVPDLPAHISVEGGERRLMPCAEVFLTERAIDAILGRGLMPLMSLRNAHAVRLARFQSVADPPAALLGPWSRPAR